jgi:hypothetical protein
MSGSSILNTSTRRLFFSIRTLLRYWCTRELTSQRTEKMEQTLWTLRGES